jgi:tetratricopeptide (TPR) repeat protein/predicted Ser/Thr protein kinase
VPEEVSRALPSARFGNFVRVQKLGAGGMGEVWKSWDSRLARWVALKFPRGGDDEEIARFMREAQTAGRLNHPNIAATYEVGEDQGSPFIAMQYVEGQTLRTFPRDDRRAIVRLIADAAQALQYAHEQGIVHRDLKPENIMVTTRSKPGRGEEHHVYVMDFGLARITEGASNFSVSGLVVGTPSYMPPEQARGEKVDARADVYSLGATLYELLTDRRLFQGTNVYDILKKVQEEDPRPPRKIDPRIAPDLETIVLKCLAKEPARRYPTAQALSEDLMAFDAGESIQARPEGFTRRVWRKVRRNRTATLAAVAVLVAVAVAGYAAPRAWRDRQVVRLKGQIDASLKTGQWDETERLIAEMDRWSAEESRSSRVQAFRAALQWGDDERARKHLEVLVSNHHPEAAQFRRDYEEHRARWVPAFALEAPFDNADDVFGAGRVVCEGQVLRFAPDAAPGKPIRSRKGCDIDAELQADFDGSWTAASRLGLLLNGTSEGGYSFLLMTPETAASRETPSSFEAVKRREGPVILQIRRNDSVLHERPVPAARVFARGSALKLMARREGNLLTFEVNDLPAVKFKDPFPLKRDRRGTFGLHWPQEVGIVRIAAKNRPSKSGNPLEDGDDLYIRGKYEEALERFREAAMAPGAPPELRQEARYKQALCHEGLQRPDEAVAILEKLSGEFMAAGSGASADLAFLTDCQLLLLYFLGKDFVKADAVLIKVESSGYPLEKIAMMFPSEVIKPVVYNNLLFSGADRYLLWNPQETVRRLEIGVRLAEILEPPAPNSLWRREILLRAYWMSGDVQKTLECAEIAFRKYRRGGTPLMDYCWILRLNGEHARALEELNRAVASEPCFLVERARLHAALGKRNEALRDLEAFFGKPSDYFDFSAAALLQGFLLEEAGKGPEAVEAWRRGLAKNWRVAHPGMDEVNARLQGQGSPILHNWVMASLTGDMTDAEAEELRSSIIRFSGKDASQYAAFAGMLKPGALRDSWKSPRARILARHVAFRDIPLPEYSRTPMVAVGVAGFRHFCFPPGPLSEENEELLWEFSREFTLLAQDFPPESLKVVLAQFGYIVLGMPKGWKDVAALLESKPRARGMMAYVLGQLYLKMKRPQDAAVFFRHALADADREPVHPLLRKVAQEEIEKLQPR